MRKIFFYLLLFTSSIVQASIEEDLDRIYNLMLKDRSAAKNLIFELKAIHDDQNNSLWKVRSNFYLAYMSKLDKEYGKSVIYYLEAIRYSENAQYEKIKDEKIALHKNIASIFQQFNAHDLASDYNSRALVLAKKYNNSKEEVSIKFNQSRNLRLAERYGEAIDLFLSILPESDDKRIPRILNELGIAYMLNEDWKNAEIYFAQLADFEKSSLWDKAKSYHNLGEIDYKTGKMESAIQYLKKSLSIKESLNKKDSKSLFLSYKTLGEYLLKSGEIKESGMYLNKAEDLISELNQTIEYLHIYQLLADYHYASGNSEKAQRYFNVYSSELESYIKLQEEIQETDKRYNMDLITKRYFDEVDKQEKIASILFYSRLTSGGLLALLLLVIGYNRYEKVRVRRSIEEKLIQFEMLD